MNFTYIDNYLTTKETPFCLPGEYKKDELLESARYACLERIWNLVIFSEFSYIFRIYMLAFELAFHLDAKLQVLSVNKATKIIT